MDVFGYVRVSSQNKTHHVDESATQRHAITKWAEENGHKVHTIFQDLGVSGTTFPSDRPGWKALLNAMEIDALGGPTAAAPKAGTPTMVVVTEASRIARNGVYLDLAIGEVRSLGNTVSDVEDGEFVDPQNESPEAWFQRQILLLIPELERRKINQRFKRGKTRAQAEGRYTGGKPKLTADKVAEVMTLAGTLSLRGIEEKTGVSKSAAAKIVKKVKPTDDTI